MMKVKACLVILAIMFAVIRAESPVEVDEEMLDMTYGTEPMHASVETAVASFRFLEGEEPKPAPSPAAPAAPSTFDNIMSTFLKFTNQWSQIVSAFKTTRSSEIKERLIGKGFDYFNQSAQIQISKGIKAAFFDQYNAHIEKRIKVPEERKEDLNMILEECKWADSQVWTALNTLFSVDNGGNTKFASILVARNEEKDTYDYVFTDIKAEFKLAPDVLVVSKKLSVLGGIWEDSKDEYINVPKSLNPEDIQAVLGFFQIVAFKGFADQFGIKLEFPKL